MTTAILMLAGILMFAWVCMASAAAGEWKARYDDTADHADRAVEFSEDCLADNRSLREQLASERDLTATYRRANCRLVAFITDGYDEAEFAAVLAEIETTPLFDEVSTEALRAELADDEALSKWLT